MSEKEENTQEERYLSLLYKTWIVKVSESGTTVPFEFSFLKEAKRFAKKLHRPFLITPGQKWSENE